MSDYCCLPTCVYGNTDMYVCVRKVPYNSLVTRHNSYLRTEISVPTLVQNVYYTNRIILTTNNSDNKRIDYYYYLIITPKLLPYCTNRHNAEYCI